MDDELIYDTDDPDARVYAEVGSRRNQVRLYTEDNSSCIEQLLDIEKATALMLALATAIRAAQVV